MWLPRQLDGLRLDGRPVLLLGGEAFGVPFVLDALRVREPTAWWTLQRRVADDPVASGNALAQALNRMLDAPMFSEALPFATHVRALRHHARDLAPLWIAVTTEHAEAAVLDDLVGLHDAGYPVVIDWRGAEPPRAGWVDACRRHGPEWLRLTLSEARQVVPGALTPSATEELWRETDGRFTDLVAQAHRAAELPPFRIPAPLGPLLPAGDAQPVEPELAVRALVRDGAWVEALELAVLAAPELVEDLLRQAGPAYQERGLTRRLHLLLTAVPPPYDRRERVLEWRLVAAAVAGDLAEVRPLVDTHLAMHVAPDLRARRAGLLPHADGFAMAEAAAQARRTPLTLWQYGRLHPVPAEAARLLEEGVRLAESTGQAYDVARNAGALGAKLMHLGEFARARAWLQWALEAFDRHQLRDGPRRLQLVNDLAYARLVAGDVAGLRRTLADGAAMLDGTLPAVAEFYRSTWACVELVGGHAEAAVELLTRVVREAPRHRRPTFAFELVRALNEVGRLDEAAVLADDTVALAAGEGTYAIRAAQLARGMAAAVRWAHDHGDPGHPLAAAAADDLLTVMVDETLPAEQRLPAALHYLLVRPGAAHYVPADLAHWLGSLTPAALTLFSGPAARFAAIWDTLAGGGRGLQLRFFGLPVGRFDGVEVELAPRLAEVALALTLHPDGVSREALNDFLTPDGRAPFSSGGLRGVLTRLRGLLPVSEAPYRWSVAFGSDVGDVAQRLAAGRVGEAVGLWGGELLPYSEAPGVIEARASLEEALRQAALASRDADALFELADRFGDDLELWEATAAALSAGDPRLALARARCRRLAREYDVSVPRPGGGRGGAA